MTTPETEFLFIVGSPRSGTTILGEILDLHPEIRQWYEPYFVWDRHFRLAAHDERTAGDATPEVRRYIRKNFDAYRRKSRARFIVDKSPRNSLKIPFIRQIFPNARFAHIIRDGRDATLSINREWQKRKKIVEGSGGNPGVNHKKALEVIRAWLARQPFWQDRIRAFWFETHGHVLDKNKHLNRLRWNGRTGWGPRFREWEKHLAAHTTLQFNALQWYHCVSACVKGLENVGNEQKLTLRYEDFVQQPEQTLADILRFAGAGDSPSFYDRLPEIKGGNFNKWQKAFTQGEIAEIRPILTPLLDELGYLDQWHW